MKTQKKLEAFAPYLPYGLKFYHKRMDGEPTSIYTLVAIQLIGDDLDLQFGDEVDPENVIWASDLVSKLQIDGFGSWVKPILRPLSDLTKPCLEGGKVPIVELAKIVEMIEPLSFNEMTDFKGVARGVCAKDKFNNQWLMYDFNEGFSMWHKPHGSKEHTLTLLDHQLQLFKQLYKWHFWLGDQGEFGKSIIDINTLKTN